MDMYQLIKLTLFAAFCTVAGSSRCSFPEDWQGRWYQGGLGEVIIREHTISRKGVCRRTDGRDKYLLENRNGKCMVCMLLMKRHDNLIEFKHGFCVKDAETMDEVCAELKVEDPLFTLVRNPSIPIPCPFQDAYFVSYNNNSGGFCEDPKSYVLPCASESKFNFQFKKCSNALDSYEKDVKFECLATWKAGSDMFLYGGFTGSGVLSQDDSYRCFKYQTLGTEINLAMSADATCRGLRSSTDGPMIMRFQKDSVGWRQAQCRYPEWLSDYDVWQDLSGKHTYAADERREVLRQNFRRKPSSRGHTQAAYRCMHLVTSLGNSDEERPVSDVTDDLDTFIAVTHTLHGCGDSSYRCVKLQRRSTGVLQIFLGQIQHDELHNTCHEEDFQGATVHIVFPASSRGEECPLAGRYLLSADSKCSAYFHAGCNTSHVMGLDDSCPSIPAYQMKCLKTWHERDQKFVIAQRLTSGEDPDPLSNCFVFEELQQTVRFSTDNTCNADVPHLFGSAIEYTLKSPPTGCEETRYEVFGTGGAGSGSGKSGATSASQFPSSATRSVASTSLFLAASLSFCIHLQLRHLLQQLLR